jgi:hypothetical protein
LDDYMNNYWKLFTFFLKCKNEPYY